MVGILLPGIEAESNIVSKEAKAKRESNMKKLVGHQTVSHDEIETTRKKGHFEEKIEIRMCC